MDIHWFPGHMAKTLKLIAQDLKLVDMVVEVLDARIPFSSKNKDIDRLRGTKPSVIVFNKADLADPAISDEWNAWYARNGITGIFTDLKKGTGIQKLILTVKKVRDTSDKFLNQNAKGRIFRPVRIMVAGIPNVGKSTLINKLAGKAAAITGDRPGITKGRQWIRLNQDIELLDTPGILPPKLDDRQSALNLAYIGTIKDTLLDTIELTALLLVKLHREYPGCLAGRYGIKNNGFNETDEPEFGYGLLEAAGKSRGFLLPGGIIDLQRTATVILDEFRAGILGRISLERCATGISQNG